MRGGLLALFLVSVIVSHSVGQDAGDEIRVTYAAGENVYVDAGRDQGIFPGDTLTVITEGGSTERIFVLSSMSDRGVLRYMGEGLGLGVGSLLRIVRGTSDAAGEPFQERIVMVPEAADDPLVEERLEPAETDFLKTRRTTSVRGRLLLGLNSLRSRTKSVLVPNAPTSRTYLTPNAMVSLDAEGLPYDLELSVRMRSEYRYASGGRSPSPTVSLRTYDLYLARDFEAVSLQAGRFASRYVPTSGYWDGIQLMNGDSDLGYGVALGFLPIRSNEQVSLDMPKAAVFTQFSRKGESTSHRLEAFYLEIHPTNELLTRRVLGVAHRMNRDRINSYSRLEVDRDPQSGTWIITRLFGRVSSSISDALEVHGRYDLRQPYSMYRTFDVISYRRDRLNAGVGYRARSISVYADMIWNFAYDVDDRRKLDGRSITGSASVSRLFGLGVTTSGSYWWSEFGASTYGIVSLSRSFGSVSGRLYYQVSGSSRFDTNLTTHSVAAQTSFPVTQRIRSTSRVRLQVGEYVSSTAFETSISVRL